MRLRHVYSSLSLFALLLGGAYPARADLMLGGFPGTGTTQHALRVFAIDGGENSAPLRVIAGSDTLLESPAQGAYEAVENVVYIADFYGRAIRVFPAYANGNVPPIRVIQSAFLQQTRAVLPVVEHGELLAITSNCCITAFPLHADGTAVTPIRTLFPGSSPNSQTQLSNPTTLIYLPATDEVAVTDYDSPAQQGKVVFFARTASNYSAPSRVLQNVHTTFARAIAHDAETRRLFLLIENETGNGNWQGRILVYDDQASGDDVPQYTIEGTATQLVRGAANYFRGLAIDHAEQRLMVGITGGGVNRLVSLPLNGVDNVAPLHVLSGTHLSEGEMGSPIVIPSEHLFRSGFEP